MTLAKLQDQLALTDTATSVDRPEGAAWPVVCGLQCHQFFLASDEREIFVGEPHLRSLVTESRLVKSRLGDSFGGRPGLLLIESHYNMQLPILREFLHGSGRGVGRCGAT